MNVQTLEKRELLAVDLVSVSADVTEQFDLTGINRLTSSPRELAFRFDGDDIIDAGSLSSFSFTAAGGDGTFGDGNETVITPGFIGIGESDRIVVARFAGDLPDDLYRISISTDPATGLRDVNGDPLVSRPPGAASVDILFDLELGPRVVAVVPQPISGNAGSRTQATSSVEVYFNNDPLSRITAGRISNVSTIPGVAQASLPVVDPDNYRLFLTGGTVETTDDVEIGLSTVIYDPARNVATLQFAQNLSTFSPGGSYRLRIGSGDELAAAPVQASVTEFNLGGGNDNTFASAQDQNIVFDPAAGTASVVLKDAKIENTGQYVLPWPGAYVNPGVRDERRDAKFTRPTDTTIGTNIYSYNFASLYGSDAQGRQLFNAITPAQQQRIREVLDLYEENLGVRFVETADSGLQFVTGDLRGVQQTADTGAGLDTPISLFRINERDPSRGVLVLDAGENFFDGYGLSPDNRPSYFVESIRGVGNVLGIGRLFELPTGTDGAIGSQDEPNSELFSRDGDGNLFPIAGFPAGAAEPDFLSHAAKVIGQAVNRPESDDVDFYRFSVASAGGVGTVGEVTIETYAQRLGDASLLDTVLQLYRVNTDDNGVVTYELISQNDDSFGDDSMLRLSLEPGQYIVGVSSTGNDAYYGEIDGSGTGGRTEGRYDLRITFDAQVDAIAGNPSGLADTSGSLLDGDADGVAGGNFNFWFRAAPDSAAAPIRTIFVSKDSDGTAAGDGSLAAPLDTIQSALAVASAGDIVRLLPSLGTDNNAATVADNTAYEIGRGGPNDRVLSDGETFEVPRGVTVMIDAGAILKLRDAKIVVGSESVSEDRSEAALQVLGTPELNVVMTSFNERAFAINNNPLNVIPRAGDWAGIEFRGDVDTAEGRGTFQDEGIFIDYVSNANIRYGGGRINATSPAIAPIQLATARPTIIYNTISLNANSAISADPNSFREDLFNSPRYQRFDAGVNDYTFTSDYDRIGPEIVGNTVQNNSLNGLFIRVATTTAGQLDALTVSGRFDDTDITHIVSQTLEIAGSPGGALLQEDRPIVGAVTLAATPGGTLQPGIYDYKLSFLTSEGQESIVSFPTRTVAVGAGNGSIRLRNLPPAPAEFVGRRLYRGTTTDGVTTYQLVDSIDGSSSQFVDNGATRGGAPAENVRPSAAAVTVVAAAGGGQLIRGRAYDYRFTFADRFGGETGASAATAMAVAQQDGTITVANIPQAPDGFTGTNVFRLNPLTGTYVLIAELRLGETSILDNGSVPVVETIPGETISLLGRTLGNDADGGTKLLPRYDARLMIDPGTVVKFDTSRIEVDFGADFYAEAVPGKPIVFTSLDDDTYGSTAGFDAGGNGPSGGTPGDWGGISIRQSSTASFDYSIIRFGGGDAIFEGGTRQTNAMEILQADVRVTNSTFENNDDGFDSNRAANDIRLGRGFNTPATVFIRGSQPIFVSNVIDNGNGAAISINPDSLIADAVIDGGRSTGPIDRLLIGRDNQGPLFRDNRIGNHTFNGLEIRGETVTVDSVWDDTDITHIVNQPIYSLTNAYGGALRLRSGVNESLVVKFGPGGTLVGGGRPLDIEDRIGGTLQVLGSPNQAVVLTSLNDDTIGAGFTPDGRANLDTLGPVTLDADGNPITAAPGDWVGLQLQSYVNDRNVNYVYENETSAAGDNNRNQTASTAQILGGLANRENASDENRRLGFNVRGTLATPDDIDTYTFSASGQTEIVIDIDETSAGLDTVVELVTVDDVVVARSDNSFDESIGLASLFIDETLAEGIARGDARPLATTTSSRNVESPNRADAGLRVVLPGNALETNDYFVRVRTANQISSGQYTLSLRLGEKNEIAGSTIRRADIRFATTAIEVNAAPLHSPLVGDAAELVRVIDPTPNDPNSGDERYVEVVDQRLNQNFASAQPLGNLLTTDRGSLVVTGELGNLNNSLSSPQLFNSLVDERLEDVDIYRIDLFSQQLEPDTFDNENRFVTTTFDIDYADQLGRPNTVISVFDSQGRLILVSRDSNVVDDIATPTAGVDSSNLSGGSSGTADAYIGPVELPEGRYFVAVSNEAVVPQNLNQFFSENATQPNTRLIPLNSIRRLSRDSFEEFPIRTPIERLTDYTAEEPYIQPAFSQDSPVPYDLSDISLFVSYDTGIDGTDQASLASFNPFTGTMSRLIGDSPNRTGDLAIRRDGELYSYAIGPQVGEEFNNANVGGFQNLSAINGGVNSDSDDGITFIQSNEAGNGNEVQEGAQFIALGMAFPRDVDGNSVNTVAVNQNEAFWVIGRRDARGRGGEVPDQLTRNILYLAASNNGEILSRGSRNPDADRNFGNAPYRTPLGPASDEREFGIVDTGQFDPSGESGDGGNITGLALPQQALFGDIVGVTETGGVFVFDPGVNVPAPASSPASGYNGIIPSTYFGRLTADPAHRTAPTDPATGRRFPQFTSVTFGPQTTEGGVYSDVLFATTPDGWLYAFTLGTDDDTGAPALEPSNVFYNGRSAIQLSFFGATPVGQVPTGLAFSNLEQNPFHVTNDRFDDDGHGIVTPYDLTRIPLAIGGGDSLYFGFEIDSGNSPETNTIARGENDALGDLAPGFVEGSAISSGFDLSNYSAGDQPTLYFTYHIEVEADDDYLPTVRLQRDSFRVFAAGDDGQWQLLATNDDFRSLALADEYDEFLNSGIPVQEIYDDVANNGQWRQARVDLSPMAGSRDVKIRFDFSTAGLMQSALGSVELVGVDAEAVPDDSLVRVGDNRQFDDGVAPAVLLQNIVGLDLQFPAASDAGGNPLIEDGDSFTVLDVNGIPTTVTFVNTLSPTPLPAFTREVAIDSTLTADQIATAVAAVLPSTLAAQPDGLGRLSLLRGGQFFPDENVLVGLATPTPFDNTDAVILVTPNAQDAVPGERISLTINGQNQIFQYVAAGDTTPLPGGVFAIEFDDSIVDPVASDLSVAQATSDQINAAFGGAVSFVADGNVQFVSQFVNVNVQAGPTQITQSGFNITGDPADEPNIRLEFRGGININDDETVTITDNASALFTIVFDNDNDIPAGLIPATSTAIRIVFADGESATVIRDRAFNQIATIAAQFAPQPIVDAAGNDNALLLDGDPNVVTVTQRPNAFSTVAETAVRFNFPNGNGIVDGETIEIDTPTGTRTVTFTVGPGPSVPNQVFFSNGTIGAPTPAATIINDFVNVALEGLFEIGVLGNSLVFYGIIANDVTLANPASFNIRELSAQRLTVPAGAQLNDNDSVQVIANFPETTSTNVQRIVFNESTAPDGPNAVNFTVADTAPQVRDALALEYPFAFPGQNALASLLIVGDDVALRSPPSSLVAARAEPFLNVILPDGPGLRTGEVLNVFSGGQAAALVFVRAGQPFNIGQGQTQITFTENSTAAEIGQQIADVLNAISADFAAVPAADGFGLSRSDSTIVIRDAAATTIQIAESRDTYAIPILVPAGADIDEGTQITIFRRDSPGDENGETYTFTTNINEGRDNFVIYSDTDTPTQVAQKFLQELDDFLRPRTSPTSPRVIELIGASSVITEGHFVSFEAAVDTTLNFFNGQFIDTRAVPVLIDQSMDSARVTASLQSALADSLGYFSRFDPVANNGFLNLETVASAFNYKVISGDRIQLFDTVIIDPGPYGQSVRLPGEEFGAGGLPVAFARGSVNASSANNNQIEGVYIDDIIVGFAERGEAVLNDNYILNQPANSNFVLDPAFIPDSRPDSLQPENPDEVLVGQYSLEIRTADNYGVPQDYDPINLVLNEESAKGRSFDTNDRLADGAVTLVLPNGTALIDGDSFTLDDGTRSLTFEYNSVFDTAAARDAVRPGNVAINYLPSDTNRDIARKTRDAINSARFTGQASSNGDAGTLRIRATSGDGRDVGLTTSNRIELFGNDVTVNPNFINNDPATDRESSRSMRSRPKHRSAISPATESRSSIRIRARSATAISPMNWQTRPAPITCPAIR